MYLKVFNDIEAINLYNSPYEFLKFIQERNSYMLELKNIKKDYPVGDGTIHALKGINLEFRESEFVSILGPSGCGKTTLLNIIGGLDQYTSGDLIINGKSTKEFKDREWDAYRNHSIGFVFQSYNLIPHQSVLQNVELALTLSGVSKTERRKRTIEALEKVGLRDQINKKPSEMSGGQMQRVAIARAIVNDPDIILADEPTGALDTVTSVQVMDILKEISKNRLVIMVTHNPDLATKYSTRIINMLDGELMGDSAPILQHELEIENEKAITKSAREKNIKKPSMSFRTSFGLSLTNLFTKKGRTLLTSFAGSIGIIGIALIFAVSQGMTTYINTLQEDTLSSYPLTLEAQHTDIGSLMSNFIGQAQSAEEHNKDAVYQKAMIYNLINALSNSETTENDLASFKIHVEDQWNKKESQLHEAISGIQYTYDMDLLVYTQNADGDIIQSDSLTLMKELMNEHMGRNAASLTSTSEGSSMMNSMSSMSPMESSTVLWQEMLSGEDGRLISPLLEKQYDVIYGSWPTEYNEIVLVLDENNELDDMALYALGLTSKEDIDQVMEAAINGTSIEPNIKQWSYEEICDKEYKTILNTDCYTYDEFTGTYTDLRDTSAGLKYLYDNGITLKISGIIRPSDDAVSTMLSGSIGYTNMLTEYVVEKAKNSTAIQAQLNDSSVDIFTGFPFKENTGTLSSEEKETEFRSYIADLDETGKASTYIKIKSIPSQEELDSMVNETMESMTRTDMENVMIQAMVEQMGMNENEIKDYTVSMSDEEITDLFTEMITEQLRAQYAAQIQQQMSLMEQSQLAAAFDMEKANYTTEQCAIYYDEVLEFSESSYESNMRILGYVDLDKPSSINIYASTFENKDVIEEAIAQYNENVDELSQIAYTDYVGLMMSSVTAIINAITYVLISFVAVSLIVSSIMIGVITLISVQERTKEIGILRAIGASKKNVSSMFNAETMIIGFTSGTLGVMITYLLCFPINSILHHFSGINNLNAYLPLSVAIILICISVLLTLIAGIIPSRSAAKKDPVVALRTE